MGPFQKGARLASRGACSRARARDERVAPGDSRIGWGGCGGKGCPCITESCCSHSHIRIESAGEGVANWCPDVAESCSSQNHHDTRTESAGEGVAVIGVRLSQRCLGHTTTVTHVQNRPGRVWYKLRLAITKSSCSHNQYLTRMEPADRSVAGTAPVRDASTSRVASRRPSRLSQRSSGFQDTPR